MKWVLSAAIVVLSISSMALAADAPAGWVSLVPTVQARDLIQQMGSGNEVFTTLGDVTVVRSGGGFVDKLKKKQPGLDFVGLQAGEEVFLLTTKDPAFRQVSFPGVKVLWKGFGFRVLVANETARMGLAGKMSEFSRLDPLPKNEVVLTPPRKPLWKSRPREPMDDLLKLVDPAAFKADLQALVDLKTRYTYSDGAVAALDLCEKTFKDLGLATRRIPFNSSSTKRENLEAFFPGTAADQAGEVIVIGHLDSTSEKAATLAPGADDNGSGAAGVLALARLVARKLTSRADLRFIVVLGEEQGMLGSKAYVAGLKPEQLARIRYVINMDMIGFDRTPPLSLMIETASFNKVMAEKTADLAGRYTPMTTVISYNPWGSDHMPFLNKKIPTVLTIESEFDDNPNYHRTTDLPDAVNFDLCHQILRLNAALLAEFAGVQTPPPPETPAD